MTKMERRVVLVAFPTSVSRVSTTYGRKAGLLVERAVHRLVQPVRRQSLGRSSVVLVALVIALLSGAEAQWYSPCPQRAVAVAVV